MAVSGFVTIGKVVKAHGLKGEIGLKSDTDSPDLFNRLERIYVKSPGRYPKRYGLLRSRDYSNLILLQLEEVYSRDQAKEMINSEIWVRKKDLPERDPDDIFISELVGCWVYSLDKELLGSIQEVLLYPGQEIWRIKGWKTGEFLFPVVEEFIQELDIEAQKIIIDPPPGLMEL